MLNILRETYQVLKINKKRTILTGLTVAWGIFMLISLLGYANGLINGFKKNIDDNDTVRLYGGMTSMQFKGFQSRRPINYDLHDISTLEKEFSPKNITDFSYFLEQKEKIVEIFASNDVFKADVLGTLPKYREINNFNIKSGRFLSEKDIKENRKIVVLCRKICEIYFKNYEEAIGKIITIDDIAYKIVGVIGENYDDWRREVYIPISTFKSIYGDPGKIPLMTLVVDNLDTKEKNKDFEEKIRHIVAQNHNFNEKDRAAMFIWNKFAQKLRIQETIFLLKVGAWVVGILSLLSGIIGVSNIVFSSVKERTHEIGIRRALGAKPSSIYLMVLGESITITTIFGYFGMVAGVAMTKFLDFFLKF